MWLPFLAVILKGEGISCRTAGDSSRAWPENKPSSARRELAASEGSARAASSSGGRGQGSLLGSRAASLPAASRPSRDALAMLHLGRGSTTPLSPWQSSRAVGVQPVQPVRCSSCSTGWHRGTVLVPVPGHMLGITARLRWWPLGNQDSIWPCSGPGFPIPALISGIARYYSYHNNVPVPGSLLCLQ